ncbi:MAG: ABC transporter permease, partial [Oscillospiraceae bacterium]|nr:ABC transporter permease [Oscillospiraceae bacterium]
ITKESNVIGTLRASGYTRGELVRHYMTLPVLVTLFGALVGNVLGYTVMKDFCAGMYYGSYSLPTYVTIWSADAFWKTTVVPVVMMVVINFGILSRKLTLSPLKFLRRDLKRRRNHRAFPLNRHIPFFSRFRLRVIFQNIGNYVMLLIGVLFAVLLLMFGLGLPDCLDNYQASIEGNLLSNYQYILQVPLSAMDENHKLESAVSMLKFQYEVETDNESAEAFTAYTLKTLPGIAKSEDVMIYGVEPSSRYIPIQVEEDDEVYLSSAYADKFRLEVGDTITLREAYEDTEYTFRVAGVYDYMGALAVFMDRSAMNRIFDLGDDYFSGYFSETEITDIDTAYIGTVIDLTALTKVSRQLDVSMGSMMYMVDGFAVVMFMILIYLLSKIIIEKNAQSISLTKILGYTSGEIAGLYIVSTSIMVVLFLLISMPVMYKVLVELFRFMMMQEMTGWIPLDLSRPVFVKIFWMGVGTYAVVAALEYRKIRKVPMDEALKNVE